MVANRNTGTMPTLKCPFANCEEQVVNTNKGVAVLNAHTSTHTADTSRVQGNGQKKSEKLPRPKVTQRMLAELRNPLQILWKLYKKHADLSEAECGSQSVHCWEEERREQPLCTDPNIAVKLETKQA